MMATAQKTGVLCVDDNPLVIDAVRIKLSRSDLFELTGWLPSADGLVERAQLECPRLVLLDLDMPGLDPLKATEQLLLVCPGTRVVIFSGHVRADLIERAFQAGAWGYVSKNDAETELVNILAQVMNDQIGLSSEARTTYDQI